jgi:hypothetical protein
MPILMMFMPVIYKTRRMRGHFLSTFRFRVLKNPGDRGLHSNTMTIKPYPEKVSGEPATGKAHDRWWVASP